MFFFMQISKTHVEHFKLCEPINTIFNNSAIAFFGDLISFKFPKLLRLHLRLYTKKYSSKKKEAK